MQYSIITTYHDRLPQWEKTLDRLNDLYQKRSDVEVCMVVDWKSAHQLDALLDIARDSIIPIKTALATEGRKDIYTAAPYINQAARMATGRFLVLQPPEVISVADVLAGFDQEFNADPYCYVVASCESHYADGTHHMWYQHSKKRDRRLNFCTAILADQFWQIGGFDDEFGYGVAYDDDDFLYKIRKAEIREVPRDDLLTIHQWHEKTPALRSDLRRKLVQKNRTLFMNKWNLTSTEE